MISVSWKEFQKLDRGVDRTPTHNTHLCSTLCSQARNVNHAFGSSNHGLHFIFVRLKRICHPELHMSLPLLRSHLPFTTSTSSSSFTLPSLTTPEHAQQSGQHDLLQEHLVHHAHLQALPVDKLRHQESLWREDRQSGGNPRTTTPTGHEPKELATMSRIEAYSGDPYQLFDVRAPITEEVKEFGEIGTDGLPVSKISETSYFQSQMHFDDSVESTADFDLEDGELHKMLTSALNVQKTWRKPDAMVVQEREVSAQLTQAERMEGLRSHSTEGQKVLGTPNALFSSEQGNLIRSSVFRNANPSNLRESLLEGNKDHLLNQARSDLAKQEFHVKSSICASLNYNNKRKSIDFRYKTHNTDLLNLDENKLDYKKNCL